MSEMHFPLQTLSGKVFTLAPALAEHYAIDRFLTKRNLDPNDYFPMRARFEIDAALDEESGLYFAVSNPGASVDRDRIYLEHLFAAKADTVTFRGVSGMSRRDLTRAADEGTLQWITKAEIFQNEGDPLVLDYRYKDRLTFDTQGELFLRDRPNGLPYSIKLPWGYEALWHVRYMVVKPSDEVKVYYPEIIPAGVDQAESVAA